MQRAFLLVQDGWLAVVDPEALARRRHREWRHARRRRFLRAYVPQGGNGAEIGVFWAHFSEILLRDFSPRKLHLVDPWDRLHGEHFRFRSAYTLGGNLTTRRAMAGAERLARRNPGRVEVHRAFSHEFFATLADESLDWIYLDASHDRDDVCRDLEAAWPKLKRTGILFGDDYYTGPSRWHAGVRLAVDDFARRTGARLIVEDAFQFLLLRPDVALPDGLPRPNATRAVGWPDPT